MSPAPKSRPSRPAPSTKRAAAPAGRSGSAARSKAAAPAPKKRLPIAIIVGALLAVGLVAVIVITMGSGGSDSEWFKECVASSVELGYDESAAREVCAVREACLDARVEEGYTQEVAEALCATLETGSPTVTGDALAEFDPDVDDPAIGLPIPEVTGADFDGNAVSISNDGRGKVIIFVAHWCSVCRQEVPAIMAWLPGAGIPEDVDFYSVSTGVNPAQANYPPSLWLEGEGWTIPVILDDSAGSVADAFGLSAFPYFVFVDSAGNVAWRYHGGLSTEIIAARIADL